MKYMSLVFSGLMLISLHVKGAGRDYLDVLDQARQITQARVEMFEDRLAYFEQRIEDCRGANDSQIRAMYKEFGGEKHSIKEIRAELDATFEYNKHATENNIEGAKIYLGRLNEVIVPDFFTSFVRDILKGRLESLRVNQRKRTSGSSVSISSYFPELQGGFSTLVLASVEFNLSTYWYEGELLRHLSSPLLKPEIDGIFRELVLRDMTPADEGFKLYFQVLKAYVLRDINEIPNPDLWTIDYKLPAIKLLSTQIKNIEDTLSQGKKTIQRMRQEKETRMDLDQKKQVLASLQTEDVPVLEKYQKEALEIIERMGELTPQQALRLEELRRPTVQLQVAPMKNVEDIQDLKNPSGPTKNKKKKKKKKPSSTASAAEKIESEDEEDENKEEVTVPTISAIGSLPVISSVPVNPPSVSHLSLTTSSKGPISDSEEEEVPDERRVPQKKEISSVAKRTSPPTELVTDQPLSSSRPLKAAEVELISKFFDWGVNFSWTECLKLFTKAPGLIKMEPRGGSLFYFIYEDFSYESPQPNQPIKINKVSFVIHKPHPAHIIGPRVRARIEELIGERLRARVSLSQGELK